MWETVAVVFLVVVAAVLTGLRLLRTWRRKDGASCDSCTSCSNTDQPPCSRPTDHPADRSP